jgi:hypothetical protein
MSVASGPVIRRWARNASSKLARSRVEKSVWSVGAQPSVRTIKDHHHQRHKPLCHLGVCLVGTVGRAWSIHG